MPVLVTEDADCSGVQGKLPPVNDRQIHPRCAERTQYVSVCDQRHVPAVADCASDTRQHRARTSIDVARVLPWSRTGDNAVDPEVPTLPSGLRDLGASKSLEPAVVPLDKIGLDDCLIAETRQSGGALSTLTRTDEDELEGDCRERGADRAGFGFADFGEREVGNRSMLPGRAPGRLAVTDQVDQTSRPRVHRATGSGFWSYFRTDQAPA